LLIYLVLSHSSRWLILILNLLTYTEIKYKNRFHKWAQFKLHYKINCINENIKESFLVKSTLIFGTLTNLFMCCHEKTINQNNVRWKHNLNKLIINLWSNII
jgi:hypothetical protein